MEAKSFFSKSSNIFSVAILLAGLSSLGAGIYISETNAKDMQKQTLQNKRQIQLMKKTLSDQKQEYEMQIKSQQNQIRSQQNQIQQYQSQLHNLEQQNNDLKNQVATYKQRNEGPSLGVDSNTSSKRKISVIATAYTPFCSEGCTGTTSTGIDVSHSITYQGKRIIASDPSVIPLHSIVQIDTDNGQSFIAIVEDRGGAIVGHKIDVLVDSEQTANNFGRQRATITILREGA